MQKRIIPILITVMTLALLGVIIIQYRWIDRAVNEKQILIDNQVHQTVQSIEQQLNDKRAISFISNEDFEINQVFFKEDSVMTDSFIDKQKIKKQFFKKHQKDSNVQMEIQVMGSDVPDSNNKKEVTRQIFISEDARYDTVQLNPEELQIEEGMQQISSVIQRIEMEVKSEGDSRLDSNQIAELLNSELNSKGLGKPMNWAVWDNKSAKYVVEPKHGNKMHYNIPLFSSDIIEPGRYNLRLSLNRSELIWKEIWTMVLLSAVFILVISLVFAYSIRLIIRHKRISQIKSDFMNNMTHEFKTPLASISLAADSLTHPNTTLNRETIQKYVRTIQDEKDKLNNQVERILEIAALNKDALDIPLSQLVVNELVIKVKNKYQLQIDNNKVDISVKEHGTLIAFANTFHLENVFMNLIDNAIKYSEGKAQVEIEINSDTSEVKIKDNGIGMTPKQVKKAFDNFYRAQSGDIHSTKGFGLGLSYSKLVIEKMDGEISLNSRLGEGTTACIKLQKS